MSMEATAVRYRELLSYDRSTGALTWRERGDAAWDARYAGRPALTNKFNGYLRGKIDGRNVRAHRVIWIMETGEDPDQIDHINGNRADNRLSNLRDVSASENAKNKRHIPNRSGVTGVTWDATYSKWKARIRNFGEEKTIGYFDDVADAAKARKLAEQILGFHKNHGRAA